MAEGTRLKTMDERLGAHDAKLEEISDGLTKTRDEFNNKFDGIEGSIAELKQLLMGLQNSKKNEDEVVIQIEEGTGVTLDSPVVQTVNSPNKGSGNPKPNSPINFTSAPTPQMSINSHNPQIPTTHNFTTYTLPLPTGQQGYQPINPSVNPYSNHTASHPQYMYSNTIFCLVFPRTKHNS